MSISLSDPVETLQEGKKMSSRAQILRRKAGNEKALFISPGSAVRQLYGPVNKKKKNEPWLAQPLANRWVLRGQEAEPGEEAKEEISFNSAHIVDCLFSLPGPAGLPRCQSTKYKAVWEASS